MPPGRSAPGPTRGSWRARAVGAALARLDRDPAAPELAEQALAVPDAGDGLGMDSIARLVLMLDGRTASAVRGEPFEGHGFWGRMVRTLLEDHRDSSSSSGLSTRT